MSATIEYVLYVLETSKWKDVNIAQWGHRLATAVTSWILEFSILAGAIHLV